MNALTFLESNGSYQMEKRLDDARTNYEKQSCIETYVAHVLHVYFEIIERKLFQIKKKTNRSAKGIEVTPQ